MPSDDIDRALHRYGILMSQLQYESTAYWTRAGFFLVANAALLGLLGRSMAPEDVSAMSCLIPLVGVLLSVLWFRAMWSGAWWIERWHALLRQLEPCAFGRLKVICDFPNFQTLCDALKAGKVKYVVGMVVKGPASRYIANATAGLFLMLWLALLAFPGLLG